MSQRLKVYVGAVALFSGVLLALSVPADLDRYWLHYLAWAVVTVLSETLWLNVSSKGGTVSMASTANLTTVALWGQGPAMWIGAASTLVAVLFVQRKPAIRAIFNAAQTVVTLWAASWAFGLLGGVPTRLDASVLQLGNESVALRMAPSFLALIVVYLVVNRALVGVAVAWSSDRPYLRTLREDWFYPERLLEDAAAFLLAPLMLISFASIRYVGVLLFYVPLQMLNESARRHIELRSTQQQLIFTERMAAKGEMAAEIAHELRNQLTKISGKAQLIHMEAEKHHIEGFAEKAKTIMEETRTIERMVTGLVNFSNADLTLERIDVNSLVQKSIEFVRNQNRFDKVEWDLRLCEPAPMLSADEGQLQQVLFNLFMNAADAMNERNGSSRIIGVVTARDERARQIRLTVTDTGTGIAASNLARIFEPHFTTKGSKGHGFGLSTSYRIINNHGGSISATSPPGQGACFTIVLPQSRGGGLA